MRVSLAVATLCIAVGLVATGRTESHAQRGPESYPYCSVQNQGATVCYFDSHEMCDRAGSGRCISNPSYVGSPEAESYAASSHHMPRRYR